MRLIGFALMYACLAGFVGPAQAEEFLWSVRPKAVAYTPGLMTSFDDVGKAIQANSKSYANWCEQPIDPKAPGRRCNTYPMSTIVMSVSLSATQVELKSAGIFPSFDYADIDRAELYLLEGAKEPYPYGVKIVPKATAARQIAFWLRVADLEAAHRLTDAISSLAAHGAGQIKLKPVVLPFGISARVASAQELIGSNVSAGLYIGGVDPGSSAQRLGLQPGDVLVELNGLPTADLEGARLAYGEGKTQSAKVYRNGKLLPLATLTKM